MTTHPVRRPPTRADVARYAGVSGAVVSYVINNGPRPVAAETAERVRAAIDILGYRPNLTARALKRGSTQILGMILSDISNPFFAEFAVEVENTAAARGHAVLIGNSHGNAFTERRLIDDLMSRQVAGLVLGSVDARPEMIDRAVKVGIPTVLVDCPWPVNGHFSLGPDSRAGARLVVDHLIQVHRHRLIAMVVGAEGNGGDPRERSWQEATRAAALLDGPLVRMPFTREGGYRGGQLLLDTLNPPSAIFCQLRPASHRGPPRRPRAGSASARGCGGGVLRRHPGSRVLLAALDGGASTRARHGDSCRRRRLVGRGTPDRSPELPHEADHSSVVRLSQRRIAVEGWLASPSTRKEPCASHGRHLRRTSDG